MHSASSCRGEGSGTESGGFDSLFARAKQAHDLEIRRLQDKVRSLQEKLAAPRGDEQTSRADALAERADPPKETALNGQEAERMSGLSASPRFYPPSLQMSKRQGIQQKKSDSAESVAHRIIAHPAFEIVMVCVIVMNAAAMAAEAQYIGFDLAVQTGHESADGISSDVWPHGEAVFDVCDWVFGVFFTFEIVVKILVLRCQFVRDRWCWIDLVVVLAWVFGRFDFKMNVNVQMIRLIRMVRLLRLIRLLRLLDRSGFDPLYVIGTSLKGSISILAWAFLLLFVGHVMLALVIHQVLHLWYFEKGSADEQDVVFEYFGNFSRSLLTMFEFTLANWTPPARVLMNHVHEALVAYSICHKMILGFAVIGIVNGVFIQETFKVATLDDAIMVRQTYRKERVHAKKMERLFAEADKDGSGHVDRDEWMQICTDPWIQIWLKSQDIDVRHLDRIFDTLAGGDGKISAEELIHGTARLKSQASPMAILKLLKEMDRTLKHIEDTACEARWESMPPVDCAPDPSLPVRLLGSAAPLPQRH
ncbi:unnamed protein product [Prorocentrum cordatum]|uniref:EF-hand domain-containing protein n=1 Tax=Prorocentrum cordatum TaxID=2364126 RepID=A0ABN9PVG2_9DINO|nr:unnamed protein product [Polarella glacialis]